MPFVRANVLVRLLYLPPTNETAQPCLLNMTFSERLIRTELEDDKDAKAICGILDFLAKIRVERFPSHRDFALMLGLGESGSSRARKTLISLEKEGIIERMSGKGRKTDIVKIPKNGKTPADLKADFEKRKLAFKSRVIQELGMYVKDDNWDDVKEFYEIWSEDVGVKDENGVGEYLMLAEKVAKDLKQKNITFTLRKRFSDWQRKKNKNVSEPPKATKTNEEIISDLKKTAEEKKLDHESGMEYIEAKEAFLANGGTMEEWLNRMNKK